MEIYKNVPKLSTIERIAKALDIDPLDIFVDKNKIPLENEIKIQNKKKSILALLEKELDNILSN
jgi:hypothetical protein